MTPQQKIDLVAKALCQASRCENVPVCPWCKNGVCDGWQLFRNEAEAALKVMKALKGSLR